MEPPPGIAPGWPAYRADASLTMLWGHRKWSARDDLHVQGCLILSQVGLLFPVNHAPKIGVPDRLRSDDLLHERQACWLDYTFFRSPQTRKPHDSSQAALSDLRMNAAEKVCHT